MENIKVLLIENDETTRFKLGNFIKENFRCNYFEAKNGDEGLKIIKIEKIDIVLTDIIMPGKSGIEVMQEIRRTSQNIQDIQIIFLTAYSKNDYIVEAIINGALDFIVKPINFDQLLLALERAREKVLLNKNLPSITTVLMAEDDDLARINLAEAIRDEGRIVLEAENGEEAVNLFSMNKIDIALLDIRMPKMSGSEALVKMRKYSKDFEAIIMTGYSDNESAIEVLRSGAYYYIKKPIDLENLLILIEKAEESLKLKRALLYRNRENELMTQIINKLAKEGDGIIKLVNSQHSLIFQKCIDMMTLPLVFFDRKLQFKYVNKQLRDSFSNVNSIDNLCEELNRRNINGDIKELKHEIEKTFNSEIGKFYINRTRPDLLLFHIKIKLNEEEEDFVLMVIRNRIENISSVGL